MEMEWLARHGVTASYADYLALPALVLDDCRLLMDAEVMAAKMAAQEAKRGHKR